MTRCPVSMHIDAYLANQLGPAEKERFIQHLCRCDACSWALGQREEINAELKWLLARQITPDSGQLKAMWHGIQVAGLRRPPRFEGWQVSTKLMPVFLSVLMLTFPLLTRLNSDQTPDLTPSRDIFEPTFLDQKSTLVPAHLPVEPQVEMSIQVRLAASAVPHKAAFVPQPESCAVPQAVSVKGK